MVHVLQFLADHPLILLSLVIAIGAGVGRIRIAGVSLGPVAVLFVSMALTAWGTAENITLEVPEVLGSLGLALFAFATGILAGPSFFTTIRSAWQLVLAVTGLLIVAAVAGQVVGHLFHLGPKAIAGTFAGAMNNTPALAAAGGSPQATIGYATAYVYGVLFMLAVTGIAIARGIRDRDTPAEVVDVTVRIEADRELSLTDLRHRYGDRLTFSRVAHHSDEDPGPVYVETTVAAGDLVNVVGPKEEVDRLISELGHRSSHDLTADRAALDFRRITISDPRMAGRRVADVDRDLEERHGAAITRVRRGDVDLVAAPDLLLQLGDRVRVVAAPEALVAIGKELGDSARGLTDVNPVALGGGIGLGLAIGLIPIPIPGIGMVSVGAAAGTLLVGLVMGRIGRIGRVVTTLPHTAATVMIELGLLVFLAYAGTRAGSLILEALAGGEVVKLFVTGAVMTTIVGVGIVAIMRWGFKVGRIRLAGIVSGTHTQPALLAFANTRTGHDPRVALGYALVYPAAMVVKIMLAQILAALT
ncbi:aspartate:alanine exchanger family transporter [Branchiibius sp. NY16-3462-2]|uniref:aspartate:alanine exchanger family transporter n=1 Tax=Branchiibius sp. NY16-3462-2 TaxID=1807500 RepID=UPI0007975573|nr:TrkA C-terminal domain-containing protein [Branchiibius sp. NY16-3462-2]KYH46386.1 AAE family transporter [Branchiibius sp. NY16-3462-2]